MRLFRLLCFFAALLSFQLGAASQDVAAAPAASAGAATEVAAVAVSSPSAAPAAAPNHPVLVA